MGRVANESLALAWERRIAKQRRSHLSVTEFCRQEGVSPKSFYAWRRRLRENDPPSSRSRLFVPVEMPSVPSSAGGIRIELPSGAVLTLPGDAPAELLTTVIGAMMRSASNEERPPC